MVLADTNIFIDFWNSPTDELIECFEREDTVPFSDAVIATLAIKYGIPVWTRDKHFVLIKNVLTDLSLFNMSLKL